jgi:hypothetical protein
MDVNATLISQTSEIGINFDTPIHGINASASWENISTATNGYQVEVYKNGSRIINTSTINTSYSIDSSNFTAGDSLFVRMQARATNTHNASAWGTSPTRTVVRASQTAPTSITFNTPFLNTSSTISWARVDTATGGYSLEKSINGGAWEVYSNNLAQPLLGNPSIVLPASLFSELGSTIRFRVRANPTITHNPSPYTTSENRTIASSGQSIPAAPTLASRTSTTITLNSLGEGIEYSRGNNVWTTSTLFTELTPGTSYTFYARRAETLTQSASGSSSSILNTDKGIQNAPQAPIAFSITTNRITLVDLGSGVEYKRGSEDWTQNREFSNLQPGTNYTFTARKSETPTHYASLPSLVATITTQQLSRQDYSESLKVNDMVRLGSDLFRVVKVDDSGPMLVAHDVAEKRVFDNITNNWAESSIREYLNGTYYNRFNSFEKAAIRSVEHQRVLGKMDKVRLLEEGDLFLLGNNINKGEAYWLITPYSSQEEFTGLIEDPDRQSVGSTIDIKLYTVDGNGSIGQSRPRARLGVVPVIHLSTNINYKGQGTFENPYVISGDMNRDEQARPSTPTLHFLRDKEDRYLEWVGVNTAANGYDIEIVIVTETGEERSELKTSANNKLKLDNSLYGLNNRVKYRIRSRATNANGYSVWSLFSDEVRVRRAAQRTNDLEVGELVERAGTLKRVVGKVQDREIVLSEGEFLKIGLNLEYITRDNQEHYYKLIEPVELLNNQNLINQRDRARTVIDEVMDEKFTNEERNRAVLQYIVANNRSLYSPPSGVEMTSKVFLLGMDELNQYVIERVLDGQEGWLEKDYLKKPSEQLMSRLNNREQNNPAQQRAVRTIQDLEYWRYWLRTPKGDTPNQVLTVTEDGKVGYYLSNMTFGGVAPAMYIDLNLVNLIEVEQDGRTVKEIVPKN